MTLSTAGFVPTACCVRWEVEGFGGDTEDDKEEVEDEEDDDDDELVDEEDVAEDVSESVSSSSEDGVAFRFKDGCTVDSRTDRPGIGNKGL